jgi:hypothetical protein
MIAPGIQETLIDRSSHKMFLEVILFLFWKRICIEHFSEGILVILEPKSVFPLRIVIGRAPVRKRLRIIDNLVLIVIHRTGFLLDFSSEPVMPALEAIVRVALVTDKVVIVNSFES